MSTSTTIKETLVKLEIYLPEELTEDQTLERLGRLFQGGEIEYDVKEFRILE